MPKISLIINRIGKFFAHIIDFYHTIDLNLSNKHIFILLGDSGCNITIIKQNKIIDSLFIKDSNYNQTAYQKLLDKYPNYKVFFILDKKDIRLDHTDIPVSYNLIYKDPIKTFTQNKFTQDILVSSNVYNITYNEQETYHTIFASTPVSDELKNWLEYITSKKFELKNIYFLTLNIPQLLNRLLENANCNKKNSLTLFITVSMTTGMRIIISDRNNILETDVLPTPEEQSDSYIQGMIEQAVIDGLISLKNYIHHSQTTPSLVIFVEDKLKALLEKSRFSIPDVTILSPKELSITGKAQTNQKNYTENAICSLLNNNISYPASQHDVNILNRITKLNHFLSKPWYIIVSILMIILLTYQTQIIIQNYTSSNLNEKFYILSESYRELRKQHPEIDNLEEIVDFHYATTELSHPQKLPFDDLHKIFNILSTNFILDNIHWELKDNNQSYIIIKARYRNNTSNINDGTLECQKEIENIKRALPDSNIEYNIYEQSNYGGVLTIPLNLIITK
jgi:hypothetical protein